MRLNRQRLLPPRPTCPTASDTSYRVRLSLPSPVQAAGLRPPYTSDPPPFSVQAHSRPHVQPAFPLRPENVVIARLSAPAVNAGRQKIPAGPAPSPFIPPRILN